MKTLELFSGAGGLAKGLEAAGFEHSFFVEHNKDACRSLRENFDAEIVFQGDIAGFDLGRLSDIDVVAGGPPCQPFSLGGKHRAHADKRDLFPYAIDAIEQLQPKAFVFENVKGLLRQTFSDYFEYIILRLSYPQFKRAAAEDWIAHFGRLKELKKESYRGTTYNVEYSLVNSADFGVPQVRERVFIVGFRSDLGCVWTEPKRTHSKDRLLWDKHVTGEYWARHGLPNARSPSVARVLEKKYGMFPPTESPWQTVRDCLMDVPHPTDQHSIPDHTFRDGARIYPGHTGSDIDEPSKTLKAGNHGVPGGENMVRNRDGTVRYFTTFEAKLIQTFPRDYIIAGSWSEAMRQIGNAVPVRLGNVVGNQLIGILSGSS